jgi:hypothetical protein
MNAHSQALCKSSKLQEVTQVMNSLRETETELRQPWTGNSLKKIFWKEALGPHFSFFFFLGGKFGLRASCLLGRLANGSTTGATPPAEALGS